MSFRTRYPRLDTATEWLLTLVLCLGLLAAVWSARSEQSEPADEGACTPVWTHYGETCE